MTTAERLHAARIALGKIHAASELLLRASNDLLIAVPVGNLHPSTATIIAIRKETKTAEAQVSQLIEQLERIRSFGS